MTSKLWRNIKIFIYCGVVCCFLFAIGLLVYLQGGVTEILDDEYIGYQIEENK